MVTCKILKTKIKNYITKIKNYNAKYKKSQEHHIAKDPTLPDLTLSNSRQKNMIINLFLHLLLKTVQIHNTLPLKIPKKLNPTTPIHLQVQDTLAIDTRTNEIKKITQKKKTINISDRFQLSEYPPNKHSLKPETTISEQIKTTSNTRKTKTK